MTLNQANVEKQPTKKVFANPLMVVKKSQNKKQHIPIQWGDFVVIVQHPFEKQFQMLQRSVRLAITANTR